MLATALYLALGEDFCTAQYSPAILTPVSASRQIWPAPMVQKLIMLGQMAFTIWLYGMMFEP